MNKEWSELNKKMQIQLKKEATFADGIKTLFELRNELMQVADGFFRDLSSEEFCAIPFLNAEGYHSKTVAYSLWHIFRIEDIVAHSLIQNDEQIFFSGGYQEKIGTKRITTGNELKGEQIADFSKELDVPVLYEYAEAVMQSTNALLQKLDYRDMHRKFEEADKERLIESECVGREEEANWLITYWCGKNVLGLIKMPFCRHWIMHIEAMQRIKNRLCVLARKGVDPIAYCGFSCNHCFLGQWCGSCRTDYNACSFATCTPDKVCPNAACCRSKKIDGCYECEELETCEKGFYTPENDGANAAKAQAMFIRKHGKKAFLGVHNKLHEKYEFAKTQEILGQDMYEGLKILEETYDI